MEVQFFYNQSDARQINKDLLEGITIEGEVRDATSIMNPVIRFESADVIRYNYCYIPDFQRYYTFDDITAYRQGVYDITMSVDVLMSFRGDIWDLPVIVDKQSQIVNGDEYIDDSSLVTDNLLFTKIMNFPDGFLDTPEYILITAG